MIFNHRKTNFILKNQFRNIYVKKQISRGGDIASTQNLLISFKPIIFQAKLQTCNNFFLSLLTHLTGTYMY
jgi:hypothetical protein